MLKETRYTRIHLEGFQSFGNPVSFDLDRGAGVNVIQGLNGVGKSTIFNGILWAEFGGNLKKGVETWKENRTEKYRGTRVIIERTDGVNDYFIARHIGFSGNTKGLKGDDRLMIFKKSVEKPKFDSGDLIGSALHKSDMQLLINESLGMDSKTFLTSIFFGQRVKSLVESPNADKRKLFEELFDLQFVDQAKEVAKDAELKLVTEMSGIGGKLTGVDGRIESLKVTLEEQQTLKKNYKRDHKKAIEDIESELEESNGLLEAAEKTLKELKEKYDKFDATQEESLTSDLETAEESLDLHNNSIKNSKARIKEFENEIEKSKNLLLKHEEDLTNVADTCPSCKKPLDKKDVDGVKRNIKATIKAEMTAKKGLEDGMAKEQEKLTALEGKTESLQTARTNAKSAVDDFKETNKDFYKLEAQINSLDDSIEKDQKAIKKIEERLQKEKDKPEPQIDIKKTEEAIQAEVDFKNEAGAKLDKLQIKMDRIRWWITKGFSASGLKAFVFNAMLHQLNKFAQKYANRLGLGIEFTIDMTKASKPFQTLVYKGDKVKDYEDLSGGQKQRVDVCLAFAMHDLITFNKSNVNILIVDELFEGLDGAGIEAAFDLIRQKGEDKTVFVITHSDIIDGLGARYIQISSDEKGNTVIL